MWVTKLLIFPVEIKIFCPKMTKFGPKLAFLVNLGQAMQAYSMPCCWSVGGCGARAVSRKTPIYFIYFAMYYILYKQSHKGPLATKTGKMEQQGLGVTSPQSTSQGWAPVVPG